MTTEEGRKTTARWSDVEAAEPAFARAVRERFEQFKHHVLATVRKDGAPRVTGLEADFRNGELWLGMMANSRKALDLRRDPRFALHANPGADASMAGGDARVSGRAIEVTDPEVIARYVAEVEPPQPFHLFRVELTEVVRITVDDPDLVVRVWCPDGRGLRTLRRGSDAAPPREER
ncbi:pyridoxamine 5'-phosphate oxidase family protein [Streptomyces sp. SAJ15]|uniref:pyridoxamine 5'-phosphate oxidase family protein n=1 Tax=Streptomyces sp. SAJ15 TaxID=2011095 RepID=UPI0011865541|nr:pyridoxamine 5'-phosphate oxidase family protein [Streptomyces sp. SAJ15]TVL93373.1 pyridoxamine 5'-phosphate oxidase [Streptomyces sp. SAJ15]